ncbi:MAG: hypothetical protein LCH63_15725 [Candidatus Melainabacteria bacterium]|uniref:Uncharacterized protein n=1 Tax=Candidatus Obscuribacter phosphatis TaxID=1906157 RepID=A0A8J7PNZ0_9BACT|nr:hypothetical protein [Candidatus Obscuribacter phosphatis]MCA0315264.1 hypothetical protein [Candidatus Melainabacteria bacterium]OPZ86868.1 MAG: hypothetical protein BWY75_02031 [bacterium ADurb.Bin425]
MNASFNPKNSGFTAKEAKAAKENLELSERQVPKASQDNQLNQDCSDGVCTLKWKPRAPKKAS